MCHCIGCSCWIFCVSHKSMPQDWCAVGISQAMSSRLIEERCRCRIPMLLEGGVRVDPHSNCCISWDSPPQITRGWSAQTDTGEDKGITKSSLQKKECLLFCDSALSRSTIKVFFNMDAVMLSYFLKEKIYIDSQKNKEESVQVLSASVSSRKHEFTNGRDWKVRYGAGILTHLLHSICCSNQGSAETLATSD